MSARLLRFLLVGGLTSIGYVLIVAGLTDLLHIFPAFSAVLAYAFMLPLNFCAHRLFTYKSRQKTLPEASRFVAAHLVTGVACGGVMWLIDQVFGASYWIGSVVVVMLAPTINIVLLELWVFQGKFRRND